MFGPVRMKRRGIPFAHPQVVGDEGLGEQALHHRVTAVDVDELVARG